MQQENHDWKRIIRDNVLDSKTNLGKFLQGFLFILIFLSILTLILETIPFIDERFQNIFWNLEIFFTIIFTLEYLLRLIVAKSRLRFVFSIEGIIDLLSVLPFYIINFLGADKFIGFIRVLRIIRFIRLEKDFNLRMNSLFNIENHLSSEEKIIHKFKTSRFKYFFKYTVFLVISTATIVEIKTQIFSALIPQGTILNFASYIIFCISIIFLIKYEITILFERYAITDHRVIRSKGIFHEDFKGTTYPFIADVLLYQSFLDKIFNIGTVVIKTTGREQSGNLTLTLVKNPSKIRNSIHEKIMRIHSQKTN